MQRRDNNGYKIDNYTLYQTNRELAKILENEIRIFLENKGYTIYTVFVSHDIDNMFFIDVEYGGTESTYKHHRGVYGYESICKKFEIE